MCIPQAMLGADVLCQAKSGMGKTAVFVLSILQQLDPQRGNVQALIICHTRELAYQICTEFNRFSVHLPKDPPVKTTVFYGGIPVTQDIETLRHEVPTIVVGTPGRIKELVQRRLLDLSNVSHFVVDECDKVLEKMDMRADVQAIFSRIPSRDQAQKNGRIKQVMMFTATLPKEMRRTCTLFMNNPVEIFVDDEAKLRLHGLQQHYIQLQEAQKNRKLTELLDALQFNQVVIFVKSVARAAALAQLLTANNFPTISIHRDLPQQERIARYEAFKSYKHRILVATDLFGRGIDIEKVNIVINYDMPDCTDTYLHRVGRAGRFGTKGLAITMVADANEVKILNDVQARFQVAITELPEQISVDSYMSA